MKKLVFVTIMASGTVIASSFIMGVSTLACVKYIMNVERKERLRITSLGEAIGVISVTPGLDDV